MTMKTYTLRDAAVKLMKTMCEEDEFGYFIGGRPKGNPDVNMREFSVYGKDVYLPVGDYDCGGSIRKVYSRLGVDIGGATSTANMRACMCGDGKPFAAVAWRDESYEMKPGDIALWENPNYNGVNEFGHVAMCVSPDFQLAEFYPRYDPVSQSYLTEDPSPGDDDEEGRVRPYYNYTGSADWRDGWTWCLALKDEYGNQFWSRYDEEASEVAPASALVVMQEALNVRLGAFGLSAVLVNGVYDQQTQRGLVRLLQASNNYDYQAGLTVSGLIDAATIASVESNRIGPGYWMEGNDVWAVMAMLVGNGYDIDLSDMEFEQGEFASLADFKDVASGTSSFYCTGADLLALAPDAVSGAVDPDPDPEPEPDPEPDPEPEPGGDTSTPADIANMQGLLNTKLATFGLSGVSVTYAYDFQTQRGLVRLLQASHNYDYQAGLDVDGYIGAATAASMSAHPVGVQMPDGRYEHQGNDAWVVKAMLVGNGWPLDLSHWNFDSAAVEALVGHKPYHGLPTGAYCDGATLRSLAPAVSV